MLQRGGAGAADVAEFVRVQTAGWSLNRENSDCLVARLNAYESSPPYRQIASNYGPADRSKGSVLGGRAVFGTIRLCRPIAGPNRAPLCCDNSRKLASNVKLYRSGKV